MKTGQSQIRNIENYYNKYPKEDIYILQEVQGKTIIWANYQFDIKLSIYLYCYFHHQYYINQFTAQRCHKR